ncbi:spore cortex-lytic enzyme [Gorillibacterium timonense]|uniref:spore cortex-lytic enzyme n=1 Tax=Gorillibacterium timonense TaxID=1689269 RepID=UPI000AE704C9|nr:spore cortex-lytic enzyme [Gorillibacterium timonense]
MRMTKKNYTYRYLILSMALILALVAVVQIKQGAGPAQEVFSKQTVRYGTTGSDVYELQGRLHYLGFYAGKLDGIYGWRTLKSVKWFQGEFGLQADGIVGGKTKLKLWQATKNWKPTGAYKPESGGGGTAADTGSTASSHPGISENDIKIMSNAVYGESRGEPYRGQVAVAAVILNRVGDSNFPNSVSGVIFQPGAFTAVADGQIWLTPNDTSRRAVQDAINGVDPTNGCTYYFNPETATSKWIWSRPQVMKIGKHIFCK